MTRTVFGSQFVAAAGQHTDSVLLVAAIVAGVLLAGMAVVARPARRPPVVAPPAPRVWGCADCPDKEQCAIWGCQK